MGNFLIRWINPILWEWFKPILLTSFFFTSIFLQSSIILFLHSSQFPFAFFANSLLFSAIHHYFHLTQEFPSKYLVSPSFPRSSNFWFPTNCCWNTRIVDDWSLLSIVFTSIFSFFLCNFIISRSCYETLVLDCVLF